MTTVKIAKNVPAFLRPADSAGKYLLLKFSVFCSAIVRLKITRAAQKREILLLLVSKIRRIRYFVDVMKSLLSAAPFPSNFSLPANRIDNLCQNYRNFRLTVPRANGRSKDDRELQRYTPLQRCNSRFAYLEKFREFREISLPRLP